MIVSNQGHLFLSQNLVAYISDPSQISYLPEPKGRNNSLAIALAALSLAELHSPTS